jgi:hypothetical protein
LDIVYADEESAQSFELNACRIKVSIERLFAKLLPECGQFTVSIDGLPANRGKGI